MEDTEPLIPPSLSANKRITKIINIHRNNVDFYGSCSGSMWFIVLIINIAAAVMSFGNITYGSSNVLFAVGVSQLVCMFCICIEVYSRREEEKNLRALDLLTNRYVCIK